MIITGQPKLYFCAFIFFLEICVGIVFFWPIKKYTKLVHTIEILISFANNFIKCIQIKYVSLKLVLSFLQYKILIKLYMQHIIYIFVII